MMANATQNAMKFHRSTTLFLVAVSFVLMDVMFVAELFV
jgi:hypothetical protein